jgi:hypothetical protein
MYERGRLRWRPSLKPIWRKYVRRTLLSIALILTFVSTAPAASKHDFQTGKLVNIAYDERLSEGTTYRWAIFTVQVGDLVYTARGPHIRRHSGEPGQGLIVG